MIFARFVDFPTPLTPQKTIMYGRFSYFASRMSRNISTRRLGVSNYKYLVMIKITKFVKLTVTTANAILTKIYKSGSCIILLYIQTIYLHQSFTNRFLHNACNATKCSYHLTFQFHFYWLAKFFCWLRSNVFCLKNIMLIMKRNIVNKSCKKICNLTKSYF